MLSLQEVSSLCSFETCSLVPLYMLTKVTGELLTVIFKEECEFLHAIFKFGLMTGRLHFVSFLYYLNNIYTPDITSGHIAGMGKKGYEKNHSSLAIRHLKIYVTVQVR